MSEMIEKFQQRRQKLLDAEKREILYIRPEKKQRRNSRFIGKNEEVNHLYGYTND